MTAWTWRRTTDVCAGGERLAAAGAAVAHIYSGRRLGGLAVLAGPDRALGPEPINTLEREYGLVAIKLIVLGLAVTPLRNWTGVSLLKFRRAIGVTAFGFVLAHLLVWVLLDVQSVGRVWEEIVKRPYVTMGMAAFLCLLPLAVTSNNLSIRRMGGAAWRRLHKLAYPAAILAGVHYLWIAKVAQLAPILWFATILLLLALRIRVSRATRTA